MAEVLCKLFTNFYFFISYKDSFYNVRSHSWELSLVTSDDWPNVLRNFFMESDQSYISSLITYMLMDMNLVIGVLIKKRWAIHIGSFATFFQ